MKKTTISIFALMSLAAVGLVGCGAAATNNTQPTSNASSSVNAGTSQAQNNASAGASAAQAQSGSQNAQVVKLSIKTNVKGSDGKDHVAFVPANFTVQKGMPVKLEISNYDKEMHTLTATTLNLSVTINAATTAGQANVTDATFTPQQAGSFQWMCMNPCDTANNEWSMGHAGFMQGTINVK